MTDMSSFTSRRNGASPAMVLALMATVAGGGTVLAKHDSALTTEQAHALSEARTRSEAIQQHCNERYDALMLQMMEPRK